MSASAKSERYFASHDLLWITYCSSTAQSLEKEPARRLAALELPTLMIAMVGGRPLVDHKICKFKEPLKRTHKWQTNLIVELPAQDAFSFEHDTWDS